MRTIYKFLPLLMALSSCSAFTPPIKKSDLEPGKSHWFAYDSNYRGALIMYGADGKYCAEPSPDTATTGNLDFTVNIEKASVIEAAAELSAASKLTRLSERSQAILVLRESMYRLCEQSINGTISSSDYLAAFNETLDVVKTIFNIEQINAEAQLATAIKDLDQTKMQFLRTSPQLGR